MKRKYYIFLGPQGSGKGTQAEKLSDKLSLPLIATGKIFRNEIKKQTEVGRKVEKLINSGNLAPDDITNDIVSKLLEKDSYKDGAIFDGYPRNLEQVKYLQKYFESSDEIIIINIKVSDKEAIQRISGRRVCTVCSSPFHIKYNPSNKEGICDSCGGTLFVRDDDKEETVKKRLEIYHKTTQKIIDHYIDNPNVRYFEVDGEQPIEKVTRGIFKKLDL